MWSHYADKHRGLVIEFDLSEERFGKVLHPVKYLPPTGRPSIPDPHFFDHTDHRWLTFKSIEWKPEKETRLIHGFTGGQFLEFPVEAVKAIYFGIGMGEEKKHAIAGRLVQWGFKGVRLVEMRRHPQHFEFEEHPYITPDGDPTPDLPNYSIDICWHSDHQLYLAKVIELPDCIAKGRTRKDAFESLERVLLRRANEAHERGELLPNPRSD